MKEILRTYKQAANQQIASFCIPIIVNGTVYGRLRPITVESIQNEDEIKMLAEWRHAAGIWFTTQFPITENGTREWIKHQVVEADDRILFIVEDQDQTPIGQIGLIHYDEVTKQCEFDNLLRGRKGKLGNIVIFSLIALGEWSLKVLGLQRAYINVLADNYRAIHIYKQLGAQEVKKLPLIKVVEGERICWTPATGQLGEKPERELLSMMITRETFLNKMKSKEGEI